MNHQKIITVSDGTKIHYEISDGSLSKHIFFVHGLGGDLKAWEKEREFFQELGYKTLAVDLRGHGLSGRPDNEDAYSFQNFASDIEAIIQQEKLDTFIIVGHCFGGMIAMIFEHLYPKRNKALILVDTGYKPPFFSDIFLHHNLFKKFLSLFGKYLPNYHLTTPVDYGSFIGSDDFNKKRLLSDIMHTSIKSYLLISSQLLSYNAGAFLDIIKIPTLIIEGTRDTIFPPEVAEALHKRIKKSELDFIKGANHILVLTNPIELNGSIHNFLKKIDF
jgi:pimeloyl-ACP methyl ester carboxylesterase